MPSWQLKVKKAQTWKDEKCCFLTAKLHFSHGWCLDATRTAKGRAFLKAANVRMDQTSIGVIILLCMLHS